MPEIVDDLGAEISFAISHRHPGPLACHREDKFRDPLEAADVNSFPKLRGRDHSINATFDGRNAEEFEQTGDRFASFVRTHQRPSRLPFSQIAANTSP